MIWDRKIECASRDEMHNIQSTRLNAMVERIYKHVPFYTKKLDEKGIKPGDITDVSQLQYLPFTEKNDLRDNYPFGLFTVPQEEIVRIHASSGTTGKPTVVGYTKHDIDIWTEVVARSLTMAHIGKHDILQIAYGYGLFTGGLGLHYGAERVGASVIPISGGNTAKQITLLEDFKSTVLACTPSYAAYLGEAIKKNQINPKHIALKTGGFGAEPWTEELRNEIQQLLSIRGF